MTDTPPPFIPYVPGPADTASSSPTALAAVAPRPPKSGRKLLIGATIGLVALVVLLGGAVAVMAGCGADRAASPSATAAVSPTPSFAPAAPDSPVVRYDDPDGYAACDAAKAWAATTEYDPDRMRSIGERAALSKHGVIRQHGLLVVAQAKLTLAAKGTGKELETSFKLSNLTMDLYSACALYKYV